MAPVLPDGIYQIDNAEFNLRVDLHQSKPDPNTPIIGWPPHERQNQKWELACVNGINEYTIKSPLGEAYIAIGFQRIYPPLIAAQPEPQTWSIEPVGEGLFRIAFPNSDGAITLPDGVQETQLSLPPWQGESNQKWSFASVN